MISREEALGFGLVVAGGAVATFLVSAALSALAF
jgi:hypothetical protein